MQTQTLIQKAQKGDVQAMTELFDSNKSTIWFLCRMLLQNEIEADRAVIYVFNRTWGEIIDGRITSEEELSSFATQRAVTYCKGKMYKQNKKAFRIPANCNFIHTYDEGSMKFHGDLYEIILSNLPVFQRFLYVSHTVAGYPDIISDDVLSAMPRIGERAMEEIHDAQIHISSQNKKERK